MGRVTLRLPDELHRRLRVKSREKGSSLNETILESIRDGLQQGKEKQRHETPLEKERRLVREALADISSPWDTSNLFPWIPPRPDDFDWEEFRRSLPVLDPPLSQTIVDERDESPY